MIKKKKLKRDCPDPEKYILVRTRRSKYWRRKRGTVGPAVLNKAFQANADAAKLAAPAATRLLKHLGACFKGIRFGYPHLYITNAFKKSIKNDGEINMKYLHNLDLVQEEPLSKYLLYPYSVEQKNGMLTVKIPFETDLVKRSAKDAKLYYFDLVLLYGDCTNDGQLRTEIERSKDYDFEPNQDEDCILTMILPPENVQWIAVLKLNIEGRGALFIDFKYAACKVIATNYSN
jgi:hypothetical protein